MSTVAAIYENGAFRPLEKVNLPEGARTRVEIPDDIAPETVPDTALEALYAAMDFRFRSGRGELAARHNEHQP